MAARDEVDVCESWEDEDISFDHITLEPVTSTAKLNGCKVSVIVEDSSCIGSQCMMPEPAIKILKRPSTLNSGQLNGEGRARPVKTLEQRQKEYEEARLRILGEARSPEDVIDDNLDRLQEKLQSNSISEKALNDITKAKERKVLSRLHTGTSAVVFPSPPPPGVLIIRTPRGPDGTKGFTRR